MSAGKKRRVWQVKTWCVYTQGVRLKFYSHDDPTMAELIDELDETLFTAVLNNDDHVLHHILPDRRNNTYCLRPKRHELTLATRRDSRNFFQRLLFKDMYVLTIFNLFLQFSLL